MQWEKLARSGTTALFCMNVPTGVGLAVLATPWHSTLLEKLPAHVGSVMVTGPVRVWSDVCGIEIPARAMCLFLATCKLSGAMAFAGFFGRLLDRVAKYCWTIYFIGAFYTLVKQGELPIPVLPFFAGLGLRFWLDFQPVGRDKKA
eukprot:TRINITY_DN34264_c0_g1_i1.p1 TRINITY_DN34264_c0_g1~~TRINITY_DN34264_c0_g1_i1.p1  ORF type:complete len:146 (+),score=30.35 TRINITY_DN34264_c0_g1_i1:81-518(+)